MNDRLLSNDPPFENGTWRPGCHYRGNLHDFVDSGQTVDAPVDAPSLPVKDKSPSGSSITVFSNSCGGISPRKAGFWLTSR
jgi:hypothetical protein